MTCTTWVSDLSGLKPSFFIQEWLTKPTILSKALKRFSKTLQVKVLEQRFSDAFADEYSILQLDKNTKPFVRQVLLIGDQDVPLTYGRVIIPQATYQAYFQDFEKLGSQLIGETLLYNNPHVARSGFEYRYFNARDPLWNFIYRHLPKDSPQQDLWARRSVFNLKDKPLLISELFLPFLPVYQAEESDA